LDNDPKRLIYHTDGGESTNIASQLEASHKEHQNVEMSQTSINFCPKQGENLDVIEEENSMRGYPSSRDEGKVI
jgi:hypothetical protein